MKKFIALLMAIVGLACSGVLAIADSHNWNEGEWIQLPSCSVQGQRKYTCTNPGCDAQYVEQVGMLEHFFLPATCTDKPICQWCKRPKKGSKELGHIKPEAACVEQKCQRVDCDKVYPATNNAHHFRPATCDSPEICRDCRIKQGQALGHDFTAATCKSPATCTRCNKTEGAKKAHVYFPATCTQLATCRHCGETIGTYKDHNFKNGKCTVCNKPQYALDDEPNEEDDLMVLAAQ